MSKTVQKLATRIVSNLDITLPYTRIHKTISMLAKEYTSPYKIKPLLFYLD